MSEMYDSEEMMGDYWSQEPMQHDQFMQGMEQHEFDDSLRRILTSLMDKLSVYDLKLLCNAVNIDVRDIS